MVNVLQDLTFFRNWHILSLGRRAYANIEKKNPWQRVLFFLKRAMKMAVPMAMLIAL